MADTLIRLEESETSGRYIYGSDASTRAEIVFSKTDDSSITIDHTQVPDAYRGQGVGLLLLKKAVDDARRNGCMIIPICSYAAAQFQRHPEWNDVLPKIN